MTDTPDRTGDGLDAPQPPSAAPTRARGGSRLLTLSNAVTAGATAGMGLLFLFLAFTDAVPLPVLLIGLFACLAFVGRALVFEDIGARIERQSGLKRPPR